MKIKRCDRCNRETKTAVTYSSEDMLAPEFDLCYPCLKELKYWMKTGLDLPERHTKKKGAECEERSDSPTRNPNKRKKLIYPWHCKSKVN